jgi:hypothetical protein
MTPAHFGQEGGAIPLSGDVSIAVAVDEPICGGSAIAFSAARRFSYSSSGGNSTRAFRA